MARRRHAGAYFTEDSGDSGSEDYAIRYDPEASTCPSIISCCGPPDTNSRPLSDIRAASSLTTLLFLPTLLSLCGVLGCPRALDSYLAMQHPQPSSSSSLTLPTLPSQPQHHDDAQDTHDDAHRSAPRPSYPPPLPQASLPLSPALDLGASGADLFSSDSLSLCVVCRTCVCLRPRRPRRLVMMGRGRRRGRGAVRRGRLWRAWCWCLCRMRRTRGCG